MPTASSDWSQRARLCYLRYSEGPQWSPSALHRSVAALVILLAAYGGAARDVSIPLRYGLRLHAAAY